MAWGAHLPRDAFQRAQEGANTQTRRRCLRQGQTVWQRGRLLAAGAQLEHPGDFSCSLSSVKAEAFPEDTTKTRHPVRRVLEGACERLADESARLETPVQLRWRGPDRLNKGGKVEKGHLKVLMGNNVPVSSSPFSTPHPVVYSRCLTQAPDLEPQQPVSLRPLWQRAEV